MRMRLVVCLAAIAGLLMAFVAITCIKPPGGHYDFNLRMNEITCVLRGVNPFSVWNEDVVLPPFVSNLPKKPVREGCVEPVNAYAPWEYTYMMPLALMPRHVAWFLYSVVMCVAMLALTVFSRPTDGSVLGSGDAIVLKSVPFVIVSYLLWSNASVGNFIVIVLFAAVMMALALSRDWQIAGGVMWALAMVKPQCAILFSVPLLMRGKVLTCVVAGMICLVASVLPAAMCHSSLLDMLAQGPAANAELFYGCGTWPMFLCGMFGRGADIGIGLVVGLLLCVWMTWLLRHDRDWLVYLMPAAICSSCWTYTQAYSHAMGWFVAYVIVRKLIENPRSKFLWALFVISLPVLSRAFLAWHGFAAFFGTGFPMSEYAFRCLDSLNSTASLAIAAVLCVRLSAIRRKNRISCVEVVAY